MSHHVTSCCHLQWVPAPKVAAWPFAGRSISISTTCIAIAQGSGVQVDVRSVLGQMMQVWITPIEVSGIVIDVDICGTSDSSAWLIWMAKSS